MYDNLIYSRNYKIKQLNLSLIEELNSHIKNNNTIIYTILKNIKIFENFQNNCNYKFNLKNISNFDYSTIYNSNLFSTLIKNDNLYIKSNIINNNNDNSYNIKKWEKHKYPKTKKI